MFFFYLQPSLNGEEKSETTTNGKLTNGSSVWGMFYLHVKFFSTFCIKRVINRSWSESMQVIGWLLVYSYTCIIFVLTTCDIQLLSTDEVWYSLTNLILPQFCACPVPEPRFSMTFVAFFIVCISFRWGTRLLRVWLV